MKFTRWTVELCSSRTSRTTARHQVRNQEARRSQLSHFGAPVDQSGFSAFRGKQPAYASEQTIPDVSPYTLAIASRYPDPGFSPPTKRAAIVHGQFLSSGPPSIFRSTCPSTIHRGEWTERRNGLKEINVARIDGRIDSREGYLSNVKVELTTAVKGTPTSPFRLVRYSHFSTCRGWIKSKAFARFAKVALLRDGFQRSGTPSGKKTSDDRPGARNEPISDNWLESAKPAIIIISRFRRLLLRGYFEEPERERNQASGRDWIVSALRVYLYYRIIQRVLGNSHRGSSLRRTHFAFVYISDLFIYLSALSICFLASRVYPVHFVRLHFSSVRLSTVPYPPVKLYRSGSVMQPNRGSLAV